MTSSTHANRLANEKSPYLLQHRDNPVDWYPWSDEAFKKAKELNRPVFLSIGYSTCHWCHVMAHESFENNAIAAQLNRDFISIKVDREERPDVDKAISGHGGWPLTVFLTPEREPFLGGTYFPPQDSPHQSGFSTVLKVVSDKWKESPDATKRHAAQIVGAMKDAMKTKRYDGGIDADALTTKCYNYLDSSFDSTHGGFGTAPKFPEPSNLLFLANFYSAHKGDEEGKRALSMLTHTLTKIEMGGIHDVVGKGFHRYSVDERWHVPHFEKMLYDQAQLLKAYSLAHLCGHDYKHVIEDIVHYVKTCLYHKAGCFYSAEDADSLPTTQSEKKVEGAFCVWTQAQVDETLGDMAPGGNENITLDEVFKTVYNIKENGNVARHMDPHGELTRKNVPIRTRAWRELAGELRMSERDLERALAETHEELRKVREQRPRPHLDNKLIVAWNALMISGLAHASRALGTAGGEYLELAERAFAFIAQHMRHADGSLMRSGYVDEEGNFSTAASNSQQGFSDDYAGYIQAALDLYETTFNESYLKTAHQLQELMDSKFFEAESGYCYAPKDAQTLFLRNHTVPLLEQDGAEPSPNSVAASNLVRLGNLLGKDEYTKKANDVFRGAGSILAEHPHALPYMTMAVGHHQKPITQVIIVRVNEADKRFCEEAASVIQQQPLYNRVLIHIDTLKPGVILSENPHVKEVVDGVKESSVLICRGFECMMPATTIDEVKERLKEIRAA